MSVSLGARLGPYEITALIGAGGMGEVWRAHDTRLERDVALKVLPAETLGDETARARLVREARLASKLNHPHICTVYDVGESDGQTYIAMELVEGRPLSARLAEGPLPVEQVLRYGGQLADALAHAHGRGVAHRDFKSLNVIVTPEGQAKVLDFGLAKRLTGEELAGATTVTQQSLTAPGMVAGTLPYMAPEQLRGQAADERSDVWALGIVLYEMATGERPFQGQTGFELTAAILSQPVPPVPASLPAPLAGVVERCLAKEPGERYQRGGEVKAALEAAASGQAPAAWPTWRAVVWRHRWLLRGSAGAFAILIIAATLVWLDVGGTRERLMGGADATRLAVLPMDNLSGDPEQEYFADGFTDALITELSRISALRVTSRLSAMKFKGTKLALPEIARALNVGTVLTGSVIREAGRVSVKTQLYRAAGEQPLWSENYEREFSSILALHSEVARAVAGAIKVRLGPEEESRLASVRPVDSSAYEAYLRGMSHLNKGTLQEAKKGLTYFQDAIDRDPADPLANAGLALAYVEIAHSADAAEDALVKAKAAVATALRLDGSLAEVLAARAMVEGYLEWNWDAAFRDFDRALEINPSLSEASFHRAWYHVLFGHMEQAEQDQKRAWELDPFRPEVMSHLALLYARRGRFEEATSVGLKSIEMAPQFPLGHGFLADIYEMRAMYDDAIAASRKAGELSPAWRWHVGPIYAKVGRQDDARKLLAALNQGKPSPWGARSRAILYLALGDMDEAFRWLAYEPHHAWIPWIAVDPACASLRKDPRFPELLRRWNLPPLPASGSR